MTSVQHPGQLGARPVHPIFFETKRLERITSQQAEASQKKITHESMNPVVHSSRTARGGLLVAEEDIGEDGHGLGLQRRLQNRQTLRQDHMYNASDAAC